MDATETIETMVSDIEQQPRTADELLAEINSLPRQQRRRAMRHVSFLGISSEHSQATRKERRSVARKLFSNAELERHRSLL